MEMQTCAEYYDIRICVVEERCDCK